MRQNTLYWHDYETFGVDPARDRPAPFAGIRTDEDLNIIGEPLNIMARPAPDTLPQHPTSSLVTGITQQQALEYQGDRRMDWGHTSLPLVIPPPIV